jgi:hypothetical protein
LVQVKLSVSLCVFRASSVGGIKKYDTAMGIDDNIET